MRIGVPKEIKVLEHRVGLTPGSARELSAHGHELIVEASAGQGIGMDDEAYRNAAPDRRCAPRVFAHQR
jgi:alanine dehydrogenase